MHSPLVAASAVRGAGASRRARQHGSPQRLRGALVPCAAVWLGVAGCNEILGFREGSQVAPVPTTSSGGAGGAPSGLGGGGGSAGMAGTGGAAAGADAGGGGDAPCELWGAPSCAPGTKCSVVDVASGATGCVPAGDHPAWSRCQSDAECANRTWCDQGTGVCKPICQDGTLCAVDASCVAAGTDGGTIIPGLRICTAYCDPRDAQPCSQAFGATTCVPIAGGFDCVASLGRGPSQGCSESAECSAGYGCFLCIIFDCCTPWCDDAGDCAFPFFSCTALNPPLYYQGIELGACNG